MKLSTLPYKGARDFFPPDQKLINYLFDVWRQTCLAYGFEEYNGPFLEPFELYAAKSGQELVDEQLYRFTDRGGRQVAIRPEMTPTVARMVAAKSKSTAKPIKWFSIANFWRYEKPQRGRLREFFQLNVDILGELNVLADFEVFSIGAQIMKSLGADASMYEIRVNHRLFMEFALEKIAAIKPEIKMEVLRIIDKENKVGPMGFREMLRKIGLNEGQIKKLESILKYDLAEVQKYQKKSVGAAQLLEFFQYCQKSEFKDIFVFNSKTVRGLDYYNGLVIEQWDKNPKNNRSLYGGGRYDNLTELFEGAEKLPATGFAMGDVTLINFLESWNLMPKLANATQVLVTLLPGFTDQSLRLSRDLRLKGFRVELYLNPQDTLEKQITYGAKKNIPFVIFSGEKEAKENKISVKNLVTGEQTLVNEGLLDELLSQKAVT